ncbi:hypothetical protein [Leptospira santarosai]|uniref:hypothetical protein n=1 Tax=Leptospira santarosai TaxID=28183 RepID=UPI0003138351|nr:hypothetical protein [Leptospira santarosai]
MKSKPVFEFLVGECECEKEFSTVIRNRFGKLTIITSDSLNNLKKEIKNRRILLVWIQCKTGAFSYGQNVVSEYPYQPNYKR